MSLCGFGPPGLNKLSSSRARNEASEISLIVPLSQEGVVMGSWEEETWQGKGNSDGRGCVSTSHLSEPVPGNADC